MPPTSLRVSVNGQGIFGWVDSDHSKDRSHLAPLTLARAFANHSDVLVHPGAVDHLVYIYVFMYIYIYRYGHLDEVFLEILAGLLLAPSLGLGLVLSLLLDTGSQLGQGHPRRHLGHAQARLVELNLSILLGCSLAPLLGLLGSEVTRELVAPPVLAVDLQQCCSPSQARWEGERLEPGLGRHQHYLLMRCQLEIAECELERLFALNHLLWCVVGLEEALAI